ncbi:MAG: MBL fold metallo-hydrolase [Pseudomonadota bacterium]
MAITFNVLGDRSRDNALLVCIDSGQKQTTLLFDCGEGCLSGLGYGAIQAIDGLFFSHLHMDHIGGFDSYFRCTFDRTSKANRIWGPKDATRILQHRFQGFVWNLVDGKPGAWIVEDIEESGISTARFDLGEAFATRHDAGHRPFEGQVIETTEYTVDAFVMDHGIDSIAYLVREQPRSNIDMDEVADLGLKPGPWMQALKSSDSKNETVEIDGTPVPLADLRSRLLRETPGDSIAYLTDFYLDEAEIARLAPSLQGCKTLVCEAQYRHADLELARKNRHMTVTNTAKLARAAEVEALILFHISERYDLAEQDAMLDEARAIFPNTAFPAHWSR